MRTLIVRGILLALIAWYALSARAYAPVWQSDAMLWTHAYKVSPTSARAAINYGKILVQQGKRKEGIDLVRWGHAVQLAQARMKYHKGTVSDPTSPRIE